MFTMTLRRLRRREEGFTLIELLVVVAIIALLATFAVPKLFEAINKAKKAPGQADMQTISNALERFYFDNDRYPTSDAATVKSDLLGAYVKANTTFTNGYGNGYIYITNGSGGFYVLVDPRNASGDVAVKCGTWNSPSITVDSDLTFVSANSAPTKSDVGSGCTLHPWDAANGAPDASEELEAGIVTN